MEIHVSIQFIIIVSIVVFGLIFILLEIYVYPIYKHHLLGYNKYKCERIPSHGPLPTKYFWRKTDEEMIEEGRRNWDFITRVYPDEKRIKPAD